MPIDVDEFEDLRKHLIEAATILGHRFLFGPEITSADNRAGWHDAWFDVRIEGLLKLNCFFRVPQELYDQVKATAWSTYVNKRVLAPERYDSKLRRTVKGADGTVIYNGAATPESMAVIGVLGSDQMDERFETALYENRLYKVPQLNLELKLVSNRLGKSGKPAEAVIVNAHIEPRGHVARAVTRR